jgi:hypothetical protein
MSANKIVGKGPTPSYTFSQWQRIMEFTKDLLAEDPIIRYAIIAAGIGGVVELFHTIWLAIRYLGKF